MRIKKDEFYKNMEIHNYNFTEVAKKMKVSRSYVWEILEGKKNPGGKFLVGLKLAFPDVQIENILEI